MVMLNRFDVYPVILLVGTNESDEYDPARVVDVHNQSVLVPSDVKANSMTKEDAGIAVILLHITRFPYWEQV
jgi:hypothetical protein